MGEAGSLRIGVLSRRHVGQRVHLGVSYLPQSMKVERTSERVIKGGKDVGSRNDWAGHNGGRGEYPPSASGSPSPGPLGPHLHGPPHARPGRFRKQSDTSSDLPGRRSLSHASKSTNLELPRRCLPGRAPGSAPRLARKEQGRPARAGSGRLSEPEPGKRGARWGCPWDPGGRGPIAPWRLRARPSGGGRLASALGLGLVVSWSGRSGQDAV